MSKEEQIESAIYIKDNLRIIRLDKYCLALETLKTCKSKKDKTEYAKWEIIGYHGDIVNAFIQAQKEILYDKLFEKELNGVDEIIKKVTDLKEQVVDIVKKSGFNI